MCVVSGFFPFRFRYFSPSCKVRSLQVYALTCNLRLFPSCEQQQFSWIFLIFNDSSFLCLLENTEVMERDCSLSLALPWSSIFMLAHEVGAKICEWTHDRNWVGAQSRKSNLCYPATWLCHSDRVSLCQAEDLIRWRRYCRLLPVGRALGRRNTCRPKSIPRTPSCMFSSCSKQKNFVSSSSRSCSSSFFELSQGRLSEGRCKRSATAAPCSHHVDWHQSERPRWPICCSISHAHGIFAVVAQSGICRAWQHARTVHLGCRLGSFTILSALRRWS